MMIEYMPKNYIQLNSVFVVQS